MLIVHVHIRVKPEHLDPFVDATQANARASNMEPGIARFELIQSADDVNRFLLIEHYRTTDDPGRHKATSHYATWRDTVEPMMAEPRRSEKYSSLAAGAFGNGA